MSLRQRQQEQMVTTCRLTARWCTSQRRKHPSYASRMKIAILAIRSRQFTTTHVIITSNTERQAVLLQTPEMQHFRTAAHKDTLTNQTTGVHAYIGQKRPLIYWQTYSMWSR